MMPRRHHSIAHPASVQAAHTFWVEILQQTHFAKFLVWRDVLESWFREEHVEFDTVELHFDHWYISLLDCTEISDLRLQG